MSALLRAATCLGLLAVSGLAQGAPAPPPSAPASPREPQQAAPAEVRVYLRTEQPLVTFTARPLRAVEPSATCTAPCQADLRPGDYQLKLNGLETGSNLALQNSGTVRGTYESHEASRQGAWLALNVGGIVGGVFLTVAALGGPSWAYAAGGGTLVGGGIVFLVSYRADGASVSFSPGAPSDLPAGSVSRPPDAPRAALGSAASAEARDVSTRARGLGLQIAF